MRALASLLLAAALMGCGSTEPPEESERAREGRAETQSIRNTEAVGYSGGAIADKVDSAITTTEQRKEQTDREADEQAQ